MAKIAYVDHSYHKKTVSTKFIPEILESYGHDVEFFWDDSWQGGKSVSFYDLLDYDCVIMFQSFCDIKENEFFSKLHDNVVYIPMLDQFGVWRGPINNTHDFWKKFQGSKVVNFSMTSHGITVGSGIRSKLFKFYRQPIEDIQNVEDGLHGFFWIRLEDELSWEKVKKLIGKTKFNSFHLHIAKDPNSSDVRMPSEEDIKEYNITITTWFDSKEDFENILNKSNVYFTPRMEEGIGQSFLEAFARGQCVVAPNNGTMNEYIQDGFTGLLYDHEEIKPLDFSKVEYIRKNTYESCKQGYYNWLMSHYKLVNYILKNNSEAYNNRYDYFSDNFFDGSANTKNKCKEQIKKFIKTKSYLYEPYKFLVKFRRNN